MKLPEKNNYNYQTDNAKERRLMWFSILVGAAIVILGYIFL